MNIKKRFLKVEGTRVVFYESFPEEENTPLILLHGGGIDSATLSYGRVISELGDNFHVVTLDLPGYGGSDKPEAPYTLEWYIEFLDKFLSLLGYDKVDIGGLSLGGGISLGYALKYPEKIRKLILIAPYGLTDKIPHAKISVWLIKHPNVYDSIMNLIVSNKTLLKANLKGLIVNSNEITDDLLDQLRSTAKDPEIDKAWKAFQLSEINGLKLRTCYINELGKLKMPVLLLTGKNDNLVPSKDVECADRLIPNSKLIEFERCGHWIPRDRSREFTDSLKEFINEI